MLLRRRVLLFALATAAAPWFAAAQVAKTPRIGLLWQTAPPPPVHPHVAALLKSLHDLGWHEGKTIAIEYRYGGSDPARLLELAKELVRGKVDVITTAGDLSTRAAQQATATVPIVALVGFPVESGFARSLGHPGGNITGVAVIADELAAKRLDLLKELLPHLKQVVVLWDPVTHERQPKAAEAAARALGLQVHVLRAKGPDELESAFESAVKAGADAVLVLISPMFISRRDDLVQLAARYRMPAMYHSPAFTEIGGLIAYGPSLAEQWRLMAVTIDRILKGRLAPGLPFQQPTRFELDINLRTARDIGVAIPPSILLRADRVID